MRREQLEAALIMGIARLFVLNGEWRWGESPRPARQAPQPVSKETGALPKPGCTAADESLLVYGHLDGLAQGWGGFGLMRESRKRIERAVQGAMQMGDVALAKDLAAIGESLAMVRDPDEAASARERLAPLLPRAWELGKRCGGSIVLPPAVTKRASELAVKVQRGELTKEGAVAELRQLAQKEEVRNGAKE